VYATIFSVSITADVFYVIYIVDGLVRARWAGLVSVELLFYMHCERDCGFNSGRDANTPADLSMKIKSGSMIVIYAEKRPNRFHAICRRP
jgi:hypothetical protein